ncbi:MAG: nuclease-related domain-containing protein [Solirubrobacteraceae bacterium]
MSTYGPAGSPGAGPLERAARAAARRRRRGETTPNKWEASHLKGGEGERRFGERLNAVSRERCDFGVLHTLKAPGEQRDIDHVVIGPAGVTVIDSKTWSGQVRIAGGALRVGGRSKQAEVDKIRAQVDRVRAALSVATLGHVPVNGMLCLVDENDGIDAGEIDDVNGIGVGHPAAVLRRATRLGDYGPDARAAVQRALTDRFRVLGGEEPPTLAPVRRIAAAAMPAPVTRRVLSPAYAALAFLAVLLVVVTTVTIGSHLAKSGTDAPPMTRVELRSHLPQLRRLAVRRARGPVRTPRIVATERSFRLIYSRGTGCHVRIDVNRATSRATTRSAGCRRR